MTRSDEELKEAYEKARLDIGLMEPRWDEERAECIMRRALYNLGLSDAAPRWIAVTERLPEDMFTRIVYCTFRTVAFYDSGSWWRNSHAGPERLDGVTHWMPLPAPPESTK